MNTRTLSIALLLFASSSALAELPICDTQAQVLGNPDWIAMETIYVDEVVLGHGLPCQASFTVDLGTAGDLFAHTLRDLSAFDDMVFQFELALGGLALAQDDVWTFLALEFDDFTAVDLSVTRDSDNSGSYTLLVAYYGLNSYFLKEIPLPTSSSSHPMGLLWDKAEGSLRLTLQAGRARIGPWESGASVNFSIGGDLEQFLMGLLTPLDHPVDGSSLLFRPIED